jgi:hypothetical protein
MSGTRKTLIVADWSIQLPSSPIHYLINFSQQREPEFDCSADAPADGAPVVPL